MKCWHPAREHARPRREWSACLLLLLSVACGRNMLTPNTVPAATSVGAPAANSPLRLVPQLGHAGQIHALAFSADSRILASAGADSAVVLWDAHSGHELARLVGMRDEVAAIAFSPNGRELAATGNDNTVRLWEVVSGTLLHTWLGTEQESQYFGGVAFSPDGRWLAACAAKTNTGFIRIWDVSTGADVARFTGGSRAVAFSPDGRFIASASPYHAVWLARAPAGNDSHKIKGFKGAVETVAFSSDGARLIAGDTTGLIRTFETSSGKELAQDNTISGDLRRLTLSVDGSQLAAVSLGALADVHVAALAGQRRVASIESGGHVTVAAFAPDGRVVATGHEDGSISIWDTTSHQQLISMMGKVKVQRAVIMAPDGHTFAVSGDNGRIGVWSSESGELLYRLGGGTTSVASLDFSPDSRRLVAVPKTGGSTVLWSTTGHSLAELPSSRGAVFARDGRLVWIARDGASLVMRDASGRDESVKKTVNPAFDAKQPGNRGLKSLGLLDDRVEGTSLVAVSRDQRWLVSGSEGYLTLWDLQSGTYLPRISAHGEEVHAIVFSPTDNLLASAAGPSEGNQHWGAGDRPDTSIKLWRYIKTESNGNSTIGLGTEGTARVLSGHEATVWALAFRPDGKVLASASEDASIRLWDVQTGAELRRFTGHGAGVHGVAFSPDGRYVLSASRDGSIRVWSSDGEHLATLFEQRDGLDWLVVTPDGLFDGSPGGWKDIAWRFDSNLLDFSPVEIFFNEFYSPGLLGEILSGRRPRAPRNIAAIDRRQPVIRLNSPEVSTGTTPNQPVTVHLDITEAAADARHPLGSGVRDLRLFRNGSLVHIWHGDVLSGSAQRSITAQIELVAGRNDLSAYAFNHDNVKSSDALLTLTGASELARLATAHVLVIGIDHYQNRDYDLRYAVADARTFGDELSRQLRNVGAHGRVEVTTLFDERATKQNVLAAFSALAGRAKPQDSVFIYFAGHGTAHGNQFFLIPHDLGFLGSRTRVDSAALVTILEHGISDQALGQALESVNAQHMALIVDACNSGQVLEADEKRRGPMNSRGLAQLAYEKGLFVLTAAQGYQAALEAVQVGHGLLTFALAVEGLQSRVADSAPTDGSVALREWLDYATRRVPELQASMLDTARQTGRKLVFVDESGAALGGRASSLQHPRVFYRRELDESPLIVARVGKSAEGAEAAQGSNK